MKNKNIEPKEKKYEFWNDLLGFKLRGWAKALISNGLNIFILILILAVFLKMGQGHVIPIDLYNKEAPWNSLFNIFVLHFLMIYLSLIMSFYPTYIYTILFNNKGLTWHIHRLGLIKYKKSQNDNGEANNKEDRIGRYNRYHQKQKESTLRKYIGGFLFIIWSYILIRIYYDSPRGTIAENKFQLSETSIYFAIIILGLHFIGFTWFSWYKNLYSKKVYFKKHNKEESIPNNGKKNIDVIIKLTLWFLLPIMIIGIGNTYFDWSYITLLIEVITSLLFAFWLIRFRNSRKLLFGKNIYNYLNFYRYIGLIVLALILYLIIDMKFAELVNPLNSILAALIIFYSMIVYVVKLYLFLTGVNENGSKNTLKFMGFKTLDTFSFSTVLVVLISFFSYFLFTGNDLHNLSMVPDENNKVDIENFYKAYKGKNKENHSIPIFYAAYGGGLKANYWNSLILDSIYEINSFKDIVAFSGVSGGGMGIGNYTASLYQGLNNDDRKELIENVKNANILNIELPWFFFWDYLREMLPNFIVYGKDRSNRVMRFYANLMDDVDDELVNSTSFYQVYKHLFDSLNYYPNIIFNSTSTINKYGVVSAISSDSTFPGAINLLDYENRDSSLTYFEAVSTCNRFPFVSPAAHVKRKGHFLDGGYYENSGIMSLNSFRLALQQYESKVNIIDSLQMFKDTVKLVSVRNDKMNYLESILLNDPRTSKFVGDARLKCNKDYTEVNAVFGGGISLERYPNYLRDFIGTYQKDKYKMIFIDLPYYIKEKDVEKYFGGTPHEMKTIRNVVKSSNDSLAILLNENDYDIKKWGIIDPPTARLLSNPVEKYMEIMMKHPSVQDAIGKMYE